MSLFIYRFNTNVIICFHLFLIFMGIFDFISISLFIISVGFTTHLHFSGTYLLFYSSLFILPIYTFLIFYYNIFPIPIYIYIRLFYITKINILQGFSLKKTMCSHKKTMYSNKKTMCSDKKTMLKLRQFT